MEIQVRGVKLYRSRNKLYAYHRKTGQRIRAPFGTAAFLAEVERLDGQQPPAPRPGTLGALITAYRRSPEFLELAPRTRSDYQKVFDYLKPLDGDPLIQLTSAYVIDIRDAAFAKHKRRFANYVLSVLRLLLKWGAVRDLVETNQAAAVPKLRRPRHAPQANRAWDPDECDAVLAAASGGLKVGIALGMFAGMREGDVIRAQRSTYDGGWLRWSQGKTGALVELPAHPQLREILESRSGGDVATSGMGRRFGIAPRNGLAEGGQRPVERSGGSEANPDGDAPAIQDAAPPDLARRVQSLTLVANQSGTPYTANGFRVMFFRLVRKLEADGGVRPGLTFHGLRHTAGRLLADRGADPRTIAALLGHKTLQMAAHYSEEADRKKRAVAAVAKLRPRGKK
jgi:integrase